MLSWLIPNVSLLCGFRCIGTVHVTNNSATPCEAKEVSSTSTAQGAGASRMENILRFKGVRVKLRSTPSDLSWRPIAMSTCCSCLCSGLGRTARQGEHVTAGQVKVVVPHVLYFWTYKALGLGLCRCRMSLSRWSLVTRSPCTNSSAYALL